MNALLFADLPPFVMAQGQPASARSMNFEGLKRRGFDDRRIHAVKMMHKYLYRDHLSLSQAVVQIEGLKLSHPQAIGDVQDMLDFLKQTPANRGIVR